MSKENFKIYVVTHKEYVMPKNSNYQPLLVGSKGKKNIEGYLRDDSYLNISDKNPFFCELTALYWIWKNSSIDYSGLVHYRRYFSKKRNLLGIYRQSKLFDSVIEYSDIIDHLKVGTIIVPKKRKYYIETLYSHYSHTHYKEHLDLTREIIKEKSPSYVLDFDKTMRQRSGYMFNMFIMSKEQIEEYCEWLFNILFELEKKIDIENYDTFQARLFGRVSEILFNVWINKNAYAIKEVNWTYMEKINKSKKVISCLKAKFLSSKFETSF